MLLDPNRDLMSYLDRRFLFWVHPESDSSGENWLEDITDGHGEPNDPNLEFIGEVVVTEEMIEGVAKSLGYVNQLMELHGNTVLVEQRVPISHITAEPDAKGSADVILLTPPVLRVIDLKAGRHRVYAYDVVRPEGKDPITGEPVHEVRRPNLQLAMYALGALYLYGLIGHFTHVHLVISQPMIDHSSEWTGTVQELLETEAYLRERAEATRTNPQFMPTADTCRFCPRAGNCTAQDAAVAALALDGFDDVQDAQLQTLGDKYAAIPMVQSWAEAVSKRVRDALSSGQAVRRSDGLSYKLIAGRATRRTWSDEDSAELHLLTYTGDRAYLPRRLISPAMAEDMTKRKRTLKGQPPVPPLITAQAWSEMQDLITQGQAQPSIVLETDPHPALETAASGFEDVQD